MLVFGCAAATTKKITASVYTCVYGNRESHTRLWRRAIRGGLVSVQNSPKKPTFKTCFHFFPEYQNSARYFFYRFTPTKLICLVSFKPESLLFPLSSLFPYLRRQYKHHHCFSFPPQSVKPTSKFTRARWKKRSINFPFLHHFIRTESHLSTFGDSTRCLLQPILMPFDNGTSNVQFVFAILLFLWSHSYDARVVKFVVSCWLLLSLFLCTGPHNLFPYQDSLLE